MSDSSDSSNRARTGKARAQVAEHIRRARDDLGLTQKQIADISGLRQTLISKMEAGQCLTVGNLALVAQALDLPVWRLFIDV